MHRFGGKLNCRLFVLGLAGFNHHLQDVSHLTGPVSADDEATQEMKVVRRNVEGEVVDLCKKWMKYHRIPGMSLAITYNGRLMIKQGFGYKDKELEIPADADMTAEVASISKPITAHLLMKLHEDVRVNFNILSDVRQFIPQYDKDLWVASRSRRSFKYFKSSPLDVSMLLCHRGGVRHYDLRQVNEEERGMQEQYETTTRALELFINDPLAVWPGQDLYTSYGYNLAGAVLEAVTNERFHDYAKSELTRLNMRNSSYGSMTNVRYNSAHGYSPEFTGNPLYGYTYVGYKNGETVDLSFKYPSGGLVSTVGDLVKFGDVYSALFQKLLRFDERSLNSETLRLMWSRHSKGVKTNQTKNEVSSYGLGWWISSTKRETPGRRKPIIDYVTTFWHDGSGMGTTTYLGTTIVSRENLAAIVRMGRKTPPPPQGFVQNINFECKVETKDDLAQSSNIVHTKFKGFTIAIIQNMQCETPTVLAEDIREVLVKHAFKSP